MKDSGAHDVPIFFSSRVRWVHSHLLETHHADGRECFHECGIDPLLRQCLGGVLCFPAAPLQSHHCCDKTAPEATPQRAVFPFRADDTHALGRQQKCAPIIGAQRRCSAKARKVPMLRQLCTRGRDNCYKEMRCMSDAICREVRYARLHRRLRRGDRHRRRRCPCTQ
jgi:hypothetical protein